MEILITICIVTITGYIIYKNIKKSSKGECTCSTCSKDCPIRKSNEIK